MAWKVVSPAAAACEKIMEARKSLQSLSKMLNGMKLMEEAGGEIAPSNKDQAWVLVSAAAAETLKALEGSTIAAGRGRLDIYTAGPIHDTVMDARERAAAAAASTAAFRAELAAEQDAANERAKARAASQDG